MARITHPHPEAGRQEFIGITFHDGHAEVDDLNPHYRESLIQHGFTIEDAESPAQPPKPAPVRKVAATRNTPTPRASKPAKPTPAAPRALTLDNFNTTPAVQPPALTED